MDLSVVLIIITIIVLSIILAAIGAYVVIHSAEEKEKDLPQNRCLWTIRRAR